MKLLPQLAVMLRSQWSARMPGLGYPLYRSSVSMSHEPERAGTAPHFLAHLQEFRQSCSIHTIPESSSQEFQEMRFSRCRQMLSNCSTRNHLDLHWKPLEGHKPIQSRCPVGHIYAIHCEDNKLHGHASWSYVECSFADTSA